MESVSFKKYRSVLIVGLVAFFTIFALWLRLLPMFNMGSTDIMSMVASDDPLYNLRQVEQLLANNLEYAWFDPMTLYPGGAGIYWGPLFPLIIAGCCIITGASTRPEIIGIALLIPPLMGAATVVVMYYVGKTCGDWKTGLLAAGFTAIISGQFFYRSIYGYIDHHIAEVLFSTIFCLFYMYALLSEKDHKIDLTVFTTYRKTLLFSCLAGFAYLLGLFVMPTMILFAMIAGIFTVIQFVIDVYKGRTSEYILLINATIFIIAIIGLLSFGLKNAGMDLSAYTAGHIYAYIGMIAGTGLLYFIQVYLKGKEKILYPAALLGCGVILAAILYITSPQVYTLLITNLFAFFGQVPVTDTVQEARGWTMDNAWTTFNYGLLLMIGGTLVMIYNNLRDEHPHQIFALVWSLVMLLSTWQHIRYEYYLAINIALLSAVCISFCAERGAPLMYRLISPSGAASQTDNTHEKSTDDDQKGKKSKKHQKKTSAPKDYQIVFILLTIITAILALLFIHASFMYSFSSANSNGIQMNQDWRESLTWVANSTPDTGVDYLKTYDPETYIAPKDSYGIMSWWDYGHMITYISKRIPNANPFQQGVAGSTGAAAYFMSTSENIANTILDKQGTRYVITDIEMDSGKFWAMSTWYNSTAATTPYQMTLLVPVDESQTNYRTTQLNIKDYYLTTVSRLHNFDGSMTDTSTVYYVEYADPQISGMSLPVMTAAVAMNITAASQNVEAFNLDAPAGYHAAIMSPSIIAPLDTVPALRHYRLVHESPTNVFDSTKIDIKYVKTFEYVKGAHIKGEGIIEVPIISNTGRNFTYRQESINGEFIVPYSTTGNPYDVKTTGKYQIVGTSRQFDVPESAIMQGLTIQ
ncbi:MAG: oligosaccharyl transferase, archaeosortase A system-associated [Methanoregula sp.]|jgi:dolichyl-diphosphooligosaccharide--protein glycosyltransferase|nr:oligosaccharyl transferase, archaeosortase A system-associated [Methanoregula sp.]